MADLNDIAVFVRVAQFESFSRTAHALGMPVSTVSRKVTALEEKARRNPPAADDAQAQPDGAGPRLLQSVQRAAERPLRRGAGAHPDPEAARGSSADLRAGHPWPGDVLCI